MEALQERIDRVNQVITERFGDAADPNAIVLRMVLKLSEELGELSEATLADMGLQRQEKLAQHDADNFKKELADVIVAALTLARYRGYDLKQLIETRLAVIEKRFDL